MAAPAPAPDSTKISSPAAVNLLRTSGTRATRRSPGALSLATPTFMDTTTCGRASRWEEYPRSLMAGVGRRAPASEWCVGPRRPRSSRSRKRQIRPPVVARAPRLPDPNEVRSAVTLGAWVVPFTNVARRWHDSCVMHERLSYLSGDAAQVAGICACLASRSSDARVTHYRRYEGGSYLAGT